MIELLAWEDAAWNDYLWWQDQDRKTLRRINKIINEIRREPFGGIAKPEKLRGNLSGFLSRRIDDKNRIIYRVTENEIIMTFCKGHYGDK